MSKYFVFIKGSRGPEGQILSEMPITGEGKSNQKFLYGPRELGTLEELCSLDSLIEKFREKVE